MVTNVYFFFCYMEDDRSMHDNRMEEDDRIEEESNEPMDENDNCGELYFLHREDL